MSNIENEEFSQVAVYLLNSLIFPYTFYIVWFTKKGKSLSYEKLAIFIGMPTTTRHSVDSVAVLVAPPTAVLSRHVAAAVVRPPAARCRFGPGPACLFCQSVIQRTNLHMCSRVRH